MSTNGADNLSNFVEFVELEVCFEDVLLGDLYFVEVPSQVTSLISVATEDSSSCFQTCGGLRHVVIVTPSTLGFRQYLKSEGESHDQVILFRNFFINEKIGSLLKRNSFVL
ncbi:hypothetical protein ANCDUO_11962 [Ancylostoma duodenale]|uniref:Uncharacterized protein n=1 Tax=Ancylostoma duodenale TaxID=51022 RepID=A0A0C2CMK9_9BILA|nr:hypothetical protein ANCDUO_11962 [Ancylostoma duodenale]